MKAALFLLCVVLGGAGTWFGVRGLRGVQFVKALYPLTLLVFTVPALAAGPRPLFAAGVVLGLAFCVVADYILGTPDNSRRFVYGLAGFLLGYLVYGLTFLAHGPLLPASAGVAVLLAAVAYLQFMTFRRLSPALRGPVIFYILVVSFMLFGAAAFALHPGPSAVRKGLLLCGASLIYVSDSLIAHNLFRTPIPRSDLYILPPYYAGQFCVVLQLFMD